MARIYRDEEISFSILPTKKIGVIGFGNQGSSQALNMRDQGLTVLVGSPSDASAERAEKEGFPVHSIPDATQAADILFLTIPDEVVPEVYERDIRHHLRKGHVMNFSHGYNIYFGLIVPPPDVDVVMVAPRMIGKGVRDMFVRGKGFPSLIAVHQDASGQALQITLELAKGIGSTKMGALVSTFEEETVVDLFSEHGATLYSRRARYEALTEAGFSPEAAILELWGSGEGISEAEAYVEMGLWEQIVLHSRTSQYGQEITSLKYFDYDGYKRQLKTVLENIMNGSFSKEWILEQQAGYPALRRTRARNLAHPMIEREKELYQRLGRLSHEENKD